MFQNVAYKPTVYRTGIVTVLSALILSLFIGVLTLNLANFKAFGTVLLLVCRETAIEFSWQTLSSLIASNFYLLSVASLYGRMTKVLSF